MERLRLPGPQLAPERDDVVQMREPRPEIDPGQLELSLAEAGEARADADRQPSFGDEVDRRERHRGLHRIAVCGQQHGSADRDVFGGLRDRGEQGERFDPGPGKRVTGPDRRESEPFGFASQRDEGTRGAACFELCLSGRKK